MAPPVFRPQFTCQHDYCWTSNCYRQKRDHKLNTLKQSWKLLKETFFVYMKSRIFAKSNDPHFFFLLVAKSSQKITKLKIVIRCQEILNLSHRDISYCDLQQELLLLWVIKFEWGKVKEACLITCYDSLNSSPFWCRCSSRCAVLSFTKGEKYANELLYILKKMNSIMYSTK